MSDRLVGSVGGSALQPPAASGDGHRSGAGAVRDRVARHLAVQVDGEGALKDRCAGRIIESALLLLLLRKERALPRAQKELQDYLQGARPNGPLERVVADALLGRPCDAGDVLDLGRSRHGTGARKRLLLETILGLCGLLPDGARPDPRSIGPRPQAVWTELTLCAATILHAHGNGGAGQPGAAGDATYRWDLLEYQDLLVRRLAAFPAGRVWEGNALAHLVALHALHTYRPGCELMREGIEALVRLRGRDGGVPFIDGQEVFVTALAGVALAPVPGHAQLASRMGEYIASRQHADGGWGYNETTTQTDVDDTARCVEFLRTLDGTRFRHGIEGGEAYLRARANEEGGFPTYLRGHPWDLDMTAGAVIALPWSRHADLLGPAAEVLISAQHEDGSFEPGWSLSFSSVTLRVLDALSCVPASQEDLRRRADACTARAVAFLQQARASDGGWGHSPDKDSDVLSTAQALCALARHAPGADLAKPLAYLEDQQHPDGGFTSVPDQAGPRPLPFDFPVLADVHVLTALNRLVASGVA
ncbi:squalene-hopene/tetraprenyl-beta-curcumene cyclase [Streptomyces canus]|uniref:Squalene-hopene/tetraprenyl-beta-curcumene cyclase n=1 Tax=Streptomyces canus TaxID=58343 RepID=A0AAW8F3U4_9ACTN|nr:prenyltransferase/squalene oxidase repeat-containing protein [Streptomyces canus]MDQ0904453.1 squalene-hopene/tetraprenyl-beta-curcumene cyclase [Streptomyces canus]